MTMNNATGPLRILELASHGSLQRGGAVQMIRLARGLALRGHRVDAVFNAPEGEIPEGEAARRAAEAGVNVFPLDLKDAKNQAKLREIAQRERYDVIHVHREEALIFAARALAGMRIPCFVAQRGTVYLPDWFSEEHKLLWGRVDRIIAVACAVKSALVWKRLIPPGKIEVVYGGVDTELFHPGVDGRPERLRRGVAEGALVVTLVGALVEKKGIDDFLRAADLVRRQRQGVRFWIVGSGKLERKLKALAETLQLGPTVEFLGRSDRMPELYAASDVVVCASTKGEGLTGTLREALAMARPAVTTACAGNTELVQEGVTGYVAQCRSPQSLAGAILRALGDMPRARALAEAGRARVLEWSDEAVRSARVEELYRKTLDEKRASR